MTSLDINKLNLLDIIDVATLQKIQDAFANATGMAALAIDEDGPVTQLSNPTDFCMKLTRPTVVGSKRCNQCDLKGGEEAARTGRPSVYYCHGGLMDFASPIIVGGRHIGSLIGGQVLPEYPDEEKIRKIAQEIGVDEEEYIEAIRKIKIVPKETIESAADLLYQVANSLSEIGLQKLILKNTQETIEDSVKGLIAETKKISDIMHEVSSNIEALKEKFGEFLQDSEESLKQVNNSDEIIKYIRDISLQITLLSFNASVESKRAGGRGSGFNAIAKEMRRLSAESSEKTSLIDESLKLIKKSTKETSDKYNDTTDIMQESIHSIKKLEDVVTDIMNLINQGSIK